MLQGQDPVRRIQPYGGCITGQRARRHQLIDERPVQRRTVDEEWIGRQPSLTRTGISLGYRELGLERIAEDTIQTVVLETIDVQFFVEHSVAAADDRRRREAVGEASARLNVVLVDRIGVGVGEKWIPRLLERRRVQVVAQAETERQSIDLPFILHERPEPVN